MANIILDVHMKEFCLCVFLDTGVVNWGKWSETSKAEFAGAF